MISRISRLADKTTVLCCQFPDNISDHPVLAVSLGRALFAFGYVPSSRKASKTVKERTEESREDLAKELNN
jgi:hypothetical protein